MKLLSYFLIISILILQSCARPDLKNRDTAPDFMEFERLRTQNPATGRINPADLIKAWQQVEPDFGHSQALKKREIYPYSWTSVDDQMATLSISKMVYDPRNPQTYYFCTGEGWFNADAARGAGVWKSTDAGKTWSVLGSTINDSFYYCQDILVHPTTGDVYVATREGGLMRSSNGGLSWQQVLGANNGALVDRMADLELTADHEIMVSAGIFQTDGIYFSTSGDPGSWVKRMNGLPTSVHRIEIATAASDANIAYCIPTSSGTDRKINGVYKTEDKGLTWKEVASPGGNKELAKIQGWYDLIIAVDPNNPDVVVAGGLNLWRSVDGGDSWEQLTEGDTRSKVNKQYVHVDQHEIVFKNSDTVLFGNDGGIYMCTHFTADSPVIYEVNKNYNVTQYYSCAMGPAAGDQRVLGGTQDNGTYISASAGISDFEKLSWADGSFCAVNHKNGEVIFTTTQERRIYRFRNGITDTITNPQVKDANVLFINPLEMDASDPEVIYQASNQGLWRLDNASFADSTQWRLVTRPWGQLSAIASSVALPNTVFIGRTTGGKIFRVENAHTTNKDYFPVNMDKKVSLPDEVYTSCIEVSQKDPNHIVVVYSNYGVPNVFETRNALADTPTWVNVDGNLPDMPVRWAAFHPDNESVCYIATELGMFVTDKLDGANTVWRKTGAGLPNIRVDMIRYRKSDRTYLIATHGRGLFTAGIVAGSNELQCTERGPRNVGGRTRTMMFDPNDPSGKKVWAGSVSGGLWVTGNIDSAAYFYTISPATFSFELYPNPAVNHQSEMRIKVPVAGKVRIELTDMLGRNLGVLFDENVDNEHIDILSTNGLATGTYVLKAVYNDQSATIKWVIP